MSREEDYIPTGSTAVDDSSDAEAGVRIEDSLDETGIAEGSELEGSEGQDEGGDQAGDEEVSKTAEQLQGKSIDDLIKMVEEGQREIGRLGNEVGQLRTGPERPQQDQPQARDYDMELGELKGQLENGDITMSEFATRQGSILEAKFTDTAKNIYATAQQENQINSARDAFLNENPDFVDVVQSEGAQSLLQNNPLFDPLTAYERVKRSQAESVASELKSRLDAVTAELEQARKQGALGTDKIGKDQGSQVREAQTTPKRPVGRVNLRDARQGGLAALQKIRSS